MTSESLNLNLSVQLRMAADLLKQRCNTSGEGLTPSSTPEDWNPLSEFFLGRFPKAYVELMTSYAFDDLVLSYFRKRPEGYQSRLIELEFRFRGPKARIGISPIPGVDDLLNDFGFIPIGESDNGDFWVMTSDRTLEGPIFLIEQSAWNGGQPSVSNGICYGVGSLSHLMNGFAIRDLVPSDPNIKWLLKRPN